MFYDFFIILCLSWKTNKSILIYLSDVTNTHNGKIVLLCLDIQYIQSLPNFDQWFDNEDDNIPVTVSCPDMIYNGMQVIENFLFYNYLFICYILYYYAFVCGSHNVFIQYLFSEIILFERIFYFFCTFNLCNVFKLFYIFLYIYVNRFFNKRIV